MPDPLFNLANEVRNDPFFLALFLSLYANSEELDDAGLAERLGCRLDDLPRLMLCRAPHVELHDFRADIARLAQHFSLDAEALAEAVKVGRVAFKLRGSSGGMMMAARDREDEP